MNPQQGMIERCLNNLTTAWIYRVQKIEIRDSSEEGVAYTHSFLLTFYDKKL